MKGWQQFAGSRWTFPSSLRRRRVTGTPHRALVFWLGLLLCGVLAGQDREVPDGGSAAGRSPSVRIEYQPPELDIVSETPAPLVEAHRVEGDSPVEPAEEQPPAPKVSSRRSQRATDSPPPPSSKGWTPPRPEDSAGPVSGPTSQGADPPPIAAEPSARESSKEASPRAQPPRGGPAVPEMPPLDNPLRGQLPSGRDKSDWRVPPDISVEEAPALPPQSPASSAAKKTGTAYVTDAGTEGTEGEASQDQSPETVAPAQPPAGGDSPSEDAVGAKTATARAAGQTPAQSPIANGSADEPEQPESGRLDERLLLCMIRMVGIRKLNGDGVAMGVVGPAGKSAAGGGSSLAGDTRTGLWSSTGTGSPARATEPLSPGASQGRRAAADSAAPGPALAAAPVPLAANEQEPAAGPMAGASGGRETDLAAGTNEPTAEQESHAESAQCTPGPGDTAVAGDVSSSSGSPPLKSVLVARRDAAEETGPAAAAPAVPPTGTPPERSPQPAAAEHGELQKVLQAPQLAAAGSPDPATGAAQGQPAAADREPSVTAGTSQEDAAPAAAGSPFPQPPVAQPEPGSLVASPTTPESASASESASRLTLGERESRLLRTNVNVTRAESLDTKVCEVVQFSPNEVAIIGKQRGTTRVDLWQGSHDVNRISYLVAVGLGPEEEQVLDQYAKLRQAIAELYPDSKVVLTPEKDRLVVSGTVTSAQEALAIVTMIRRVRTIPVIDQLRVTGR